MKKSLLFIALIGLGFSAMSINPRPFVKSGNHKIYCEKIIEGLFNIKIFLPGSDTPIKVSYSDIDAYSLEGRLFQKRTIEEEDINEAFMEVKERRGTLSLVCYEDYREVRVTSDLVLKTPKRRLFLFDRDVFLCEMSEAKAKELCEYFSL